MSSFCTSFSFQVLPESCITIFTTTVKHVNELMQIHICFPIDGAQQSDVCLRQGNIILFTELILMIHKNNMDF